MCAAHHSRLQWSTLLALWVYISSYRASVPISVIGKITVLCLSLRHMDFAHYVCVKTIICIKDIVVQVIYFTGTYQDGHSWFTFLEY